MQRKVAYVTIETFSKLRFSGFKKFVTMQVFEELQLIEFQNFLLQIFLLFNFKINYDVLKSKSPCVLLN